MAIVAALTAPINAQRARAQEAPVLPPAADFNRDGHPDLIWLTKPGPFGSLSIWSMGGGAHGEKVLAGFPTTAPPMPAGWRVAGAGDFDGNGYTDLIFESDTGVLGVWAFTSYPFDPGSVFTYATALTPSRVDDPNWQIRAVGDLNHDGHPDLIWQYAPTGQVAFWLMTGTSAIAYIVPNVDAPGGDWEIVGSGDSNCDGELDIFWQQRSTGTLAVWWMNGTSIVDGSLLSASPDPRWHVVAVADLDGDAYSDLILQHVDTGIVGAWYLRESLVRFGLSLVPAAIIIPGYDYRIVGPR